MGQNVCKKETPRDSEQQSDGAAVSRQVIDANFTTELPNDTLQNDALKELALKWAETDPTTAISWLQSLSSRTERSAASLLIADILSTRDPVAALDLLSAIDPSGERDESLKHAIAQWAGLQAEAALHWAGQIPDAQLREKLIAAATVACAEENPELAGALAVTNLPAGRIQNDTIVSVVQQWAQTNPEGAAEWVAQFPSGMVRSEAAANLFAIWANTDRAGAVSYLENLPDGWLRETARNEISRAISEPEPIVESGSTL